MPLRPFFSLLLASLLFLPALGGNVAVADEPATEGPAPTAPEGDPPAPPDGEKAPGETPEEGAGADGTAPPPGPEPEEPRGFQEDPRDLPDPEEPEQPTPEPGAAPPVQEIERQEIPAPAGMLHVPVGDGWVRIGTEPQVLLPRIDRLDDKVKNRFYFETPEHDRYLPPYAIARYEMTNAQYHRFLADTARAVYDSTRGNRPNLQAVAGSLVGLEPHKFESNDVVWKQLYHANKAQLHEKMPGVIVKKDDGAIDERATEEAFRRAQLPRGLMLEFYDRPPPDNWPDVAPSEKQLDLPVTFVSLNDCIAFCEWAGLHVPTEAEWEFAGRGPKRHEFPWGNDFPPDASRANWGGKIVDESFMPRLVPVFELPAGRSWCGAHNMTGNVAEWTSSLFDLYPKSRANKDEARLGAVYIIRGGSLADLDPLALRLAARNFEGQGAAAPPFPMNDYQYVGFRYAWYGVPGLDAQPPILARATAHKRVQVGNLAKARMAAATITQFAEPGAKVEHGVFVLGRARTLFVMPLASLQAADQKKPMKDLKDLREESEGLDGIPLGVLHLDVPLNKVFVRGAPPEKWRPKSFGRGKGESMYTVEGSCRPGTYLIAMLHRRLALLTPSLEFACFVEPEKVTTDYVDIPRKGLESTPPTTLEVDPDAGMIAIQFAVPLGGKGNDEKMHITVGAVLLASPDHLAGAWQVSKAEDVERAVPRTEKPNPPTEEKPK